MKDATPTFTSSVKDTGAASKALTGATAGNVSMIKGFNYMECNMVATAYKGATIKSYKISNGSNVVNAATATFNNSEHNSFKFEVWDSRGNYNSYTQEIRMIDYLAPTCSVEARIALGNADSTTANITFTVKGNVFNGSFGAVDNSLSLDYTISNDAGEIAARGSLEAIYNGNTYSAEKLVEGLDYRKSYIVYVAAHDAINSGISATSKMLKAIPVFDWSEEDFNFNVPITIQGTDVMETINTLNARDYVIEQGTSGVWSYVKWNSGRCELYAYNPSNIAVNNQQGTALYRSNVVTLNLPFRVYNMTACVTCTDVNAWASSNTYRSTTGNTAISYVFWRGGSYAAYTWYAYIYITGTWK